MRLLELLDVRSYRTAVADLLARHPPGGRPERAARRARGLRGAAASRPTTSTCPSRRSSARTSATASPGASGSARTSSSACWRSATRARASTEVTRLLAEVRRGLLLAARRRRARARTAGCGCRTSSRPSSASRPASSRRPCRGRRDDQPLSCAGDPARPRPRAVPRLRRPAAPPAHRLRGLRALERARPPRARVRLAAGPGMEAVLTGGRDLRVTRDEPLHAELARLRASVELNPYERELRYGYPYVVGRLDGQVVRAPLLRSPWSWSRTARRSRSPRPTTSRASTRCPSAPASADAARDAVLARLIDDTPAFPVTREALDALRARRSSATSASSAAGRSTAPSPSRPRVPSSGEGLRLIDARRGLRRAAHGYFLASDLERIAELPEGTADGTALGALLGARGSEAQSETFAAATTTRLLPVPLQPRAGAGGAAGRATGEPRRRRPGPAGHGQVADDREHRRAPRGVGPARARDVAEGRGPARGRRAAAAARALAAADDAAPPGRRLQARPARAAGARCRSRAARSRRPPSRSCAAASTPPRATPSRPAMASCGRRWSPSTTSSAPRRGRRTRRA